MGLWVHTCSLQTPSRPAPQLHALRLPGAPLAAPRFRLLLLASSLISPGPRMTAAFCQHCARPPSSLQVPDSAVPWGGYPKPNKGALQWHSTRARQGCAHWQAAGPLLQRRGGCADIPMSRGYRRNILLYLHGTSWALGHTWAVLWGHVLGTLHARAAELRWASGKGLGPVPGSLQLHVHSRPLPGGSVLGIHDASSTPYVPHIGPTPDFLEPVTSC